MDGILKPVKLPAGERTTVKVPRPLHRRLRKTAKSNRVQMGSLTEFILTVGLERIEREGLPVPLSISA